MKKLSFLYFFAVLTLFVSCEEEQTPDLGVDEQWLQFGQQNYTVTENSAEPLVVKVFYAADTNPNGVTVNYSVVSDNPGAYEITPAGGTLEIPAGSFEADITITPIDNADTDGNKEIQLSIDNQDIPVGLVGEGVFSHVTTVTITDNDCELDMVSFEGTYLAKEFGYCDGCYEVSVTYDEANDVLVLDNLYETGGTTYIALDNSDPENPAITFRNFNDLGGIIYPSHPSYGDGYAINPSDLSGDSSDDLSSFRTCDKFMDLYFRVYFPGVGAYPTTRVQLTKI